MRSLTTEQWQSLRDAFITITKEDHAPTRRAMIAAEQRDFSAILQAEGFEGSVEVPGMMGARIDPFYDHFQRFELALHDRTKAPEIFEKDVENLLISLNLTKQFVTATTKRKSYGSDEVDVFDEKLSKPLSDPFVGSGSIEEGPKDGGSFDEELDEDYVLTPDSSAKEPDEIFTLAGEPDISDDDDVRPLVRKEAPKQHSWLKVKAKQVAIAGAMVGSYFAGDAIGNKRGVEQGASDPISHIVGGVEPRQRTTAEDEKDGRQLVANPEARARLERHVDQLAKTRKTAAGIARHTAEELEPLERNR